MCRTAARTVPLCGCRGCQAQSGVCARAQPCFPRTLPASSLCVPAHTWSRSPGPLSVHPSALMCPLHSVPRLHLEDFSLDSSPSQEVLGSQVASQPLAGPGREGSSSRASPGGGSAPATASALQPGGSGDTAAAAGPRVALPGAEPGGRRRGRPEANTPQVVTTALGREQGPLPWCLRGDRRTGDSW